MIMYFLSIAVGCPTYTAPEHTTTEIVNNSLVIECMSSGDIWKIKCINGIWLGIVGSCLPRRYTIPFKLHCGCTMVKGRAMM